MRLNREKKIIDPDQDEPITNYPGHLTFLKRFGIKDIKAFHRNKVVASIRNDAPHIVFDFRYEYLHTRENLFASIYRQFGEVISTNHKVDEPFQINFCNYNSDGYFNKKYGQNMGIDENLIFETKNSYMDVFPREKLIYLSKAAEKEMEKFDYNKVYIIGCMIDSNIDDCQFASLNQAKRDGIECQRLPLYKYVK